MERNRLRSAARALAGAAVLAGCSGSTENASVRETREVRLDGENPFVETSSAERFGFRMRRDDTAPSDDPHGPGGPPRLIWDTPQAWQELPTSQFRVANFRVGGDQRAECYLTVLSGDAGGLVANVDRWRVQLGLGPTSAAELADAPRATLLGLDAIQVDFAGAYSGMGGSETREGWRLVGLLAIHPSGSAFLKMTGPAEVLARELRAFDALASSFRLESSPTSAPSGPTGGDTIADAPGASGAGGFSWTLPEGWRRGPDDAMRLAGFYVDGGTDLIATLTVLSGDGGGLAANVTRWRRQLGLPPPSEAEPAALPKVPMLSSEATLVEIEGETRMIGVIGSLPGRTIFVKLSGADARVSAQRKALLAFCAALEQSR